MKLAIVTAITGAILLCLAGAGQAQHRAAPSIEAFYKGRTVNLFVANSPGGRYDLNARLIARHLGRFIPGEPVVNVQNLVGGGGLIMANRLYNTADRDGATIAVLQPGAAQVAIQGDPNAKFDPAKITWLGSLSSFGDDADLLIVAPGHAARSAQDLRQALSATLGAGTPGSTNLTFPLIAQEVLGLNLKIVRGYPTAPFLEMERGEIDGQVVLMSSIKSTQPALWASQKFKALVQFGRSTRHPALPETPTARELVSNPQNLALLEFAELAFLMSLPLVAPPGLPPERADALKRAFMAMTQDAEFRKEANQMQIDYSPIDGAAVLELVQKAMATPRAVVEQYNKIVPPGN